MSGFVPDEASMPYFGLFIFPVTANLCRIAKSLRVNEGRLNPTREDTIGSARDERGVQSC